MATAQADLPRSAAQWVARWKTRPLAILAATRARLNQLQQTAADPSPADLARVVQTDPFLVFLLLKAVNNRQRGEFASEVTGVENALKLIGVERFQQQFGHLPLIEERLKPGSGEYALLLQQILIAHQAADLARDWAVARLDMKPEEVYVAALLHNQAWCQLALHEPQLARHWAPWHASPLQDDAEVQRSLLGTSLTELQLTLLQQEALPASLAELLAADSATSPRALTLQLAIGFARQCIAGWQHPQLWQHLGSMAELARRDTDAIWNRSQKVILDFARQWQHPQIPPPAAWLPLLPGSWSRAPQAAATGAEPAQSADAAPSAPEPDRMQQLQAQLGRAANFNQTMSLILRELQQGLQLQRVVFALLGADQCTLRVRYALGVDAADPLARFQFDTRQSALLAKLQQKTASIWINASNAAQYRPHLPADWNTCVGDGEFLLMSLCVGDRPIGLILADRAGLRPLDEAGYNGFKQICLLGVRSLGQLAGTSPAAASSS